MKLKSYSGKIVSGVLFYSATVIEWSFRTTVIFHVFSQTLNGIFSHILTSPTQIYMFISLFLDETIFFCGGVGTAVFPTVLYTTITNISIVSTIKLSSKIKQNKKTHNYFYSTHPWKKAWSFMKCKKRRWSLYHPYVDTYHNKLLMLCFCLKCAY